MSRRKRIGIMGGTFDPVHMVHLTLAENAYHSFGLDEVLMLPNGDPPHKTDKIITPAVHRLAMLQLAVEGIPYFRISDMEIRRKGYSYSSVTLEELKKETGVSALDVAKAMLDAGIHPPTMYFPLIVHEALMFEPTETESPETLDEAAAVLAEILRRAKEEPEALHAAPASTPVGRPDETAAARRPVVRYAFPEG